MTNLQIQVLEAFFLALINRKSIQLPNRFFKPFDSSLALACHGGVIANSVAKFDGSVLLVQCTGGRNLGVKMLGNVESALNSSLDTIRWRYVIYVRSGAYQMSPKHVVFGGNGVQCDRIDRMSK